MSARARSSFVRHRSTSLFVLERDCSCCGWELDRGDRRGSAAADPAVACCLCSQMYSLVMGESGGVVERIDVFYIFQFLPACV